MDDAGHNKLGIIQLGLQEWEEKSNGMRLAAGPGPGVWSTARASSCGLFHIAYPNAPEPLRNELRTVYSQLCRDNMSMVRRAAATNLGKFAATIEQPYLKNDIMPIFKNLTQDDQDSVRILAVMSCAALGKLLEPQDCVAELLPVIVKCAQDESWRVRHMVADQLNELCEAIGPDATRTDLVIAFVWLLCDDEAEVHTAAAGQLPKFCQILSPELLVQHILPCVKELSSSDSSQHIHSVLASVSMRMAPILGKHLTNTGWRGVCGAVLGINDIAYHCQTCQHDPTCAICVPCFQNGNHKDHDYSFIICEGGDCCGCGDVTAWKCEGFCSNHKGATGIQPLPEELATSLSPVLDSLLSCWRTRLLFAESIFEQSPRLNSHAIEHKVITDELTSAVVEILLDFCKNGEILLSFISSKVFSSEGLLYILVRAERFTISGDIVRKLHELLLKLLGEPQFRYEFAKAFLSYYPTVIKEAVKEIDGTIFERCPLLSTFSAKIFTVPTLTPRLVKETDLLMTLLDGLGDILMSCAGDNGRLEVIKGAELYEITIELVRYIGQVMSHSEVTRYVTHGRPDILRTWMKVLNLLQGMNPQKRETSFHEEGGSITNMKLPFGLEHVLGLCIHCLLVDGAFADESFSVARRLAFECLRSIDEWLDQDLADVGIASNSGQHLAQKLEAFRVLSFSHWPEIAYEVSLQDISLHIPLIDYFH